MMYSISNFLFVVFYYLIRYRRKVIVSNIYSSFPNKSNEEKKLLVRQYYRHFCDLLLESLKNISISSSQLNDRVKFENVELLDGYYNQGKSVIALGGHYGNWEMFLMAAGRVSKLKQFAAYKTLANPYFDRKLKSIRGNFGLSLLAKQDTKTFFQEKSDTPRMITFGADQWTSNPERAFWLNFLNKETPFHYGVEKYAKEFDWPVIYWEVIKTKRGHYTVKYHKLCEEPTQEEKGGIITKFALALEETICREPQYWLWSHKRWKRTKEQVFGK